MPPSTYLTTSAAGLQFRLRSLLLVVTWLACVFATTGAVPAVGIVAAVLTLPALFRTWKYACQLDKAGWSVSTGELVDTFIGSLAILVGIAGVWLFVAVAAAGVAFLAGASLAMRLCGVVADAMTPAGEHGRRAVHRVLSVALRQFAWRRRLIARRPAGLGRPLVGVAILPAVVICAGAAIALACIVAFLTALGIICRGFSKVGKSVGWLERQLLRGIHALLQGKHKWMRLFQKAAEFAPTPPAG